MGGWCKEESFSDYTVLYAMQNKFNATIAQRSAAISQQWFNLHLPSCGPGLVAGPSSTLLKWNFVLYLSLY